MRRMKGMKFIDVVCESCWERGKVGKNEEWKVFQRTNHYDERFFKLYYLFYYDFK